MQQIPIFLLDHRATSGVPAILDHTMYDVLL